ncbi:beta-N-acetylhexosaminidase [Cellulomonas sp. A375-1]|uniref:glycoside hydrolase family 3 N-terminal domain-containing protein n=1 Tax=Cellulomonas sp. A375-1 TaxID=1672219 RepID=UPI000652763F|nr:glycoside hydrolase family 3 N-terminal domain-containing protein [Cellulomonas sp. A375-1]KMM46374.1 beta-N-acetylhexosaminidase [Cellulomonas sp. A375-1]
MSRAERVALVVAVVLVAVAVGVGAVVLGQGRASSAGPSSGLPSPSPTSTPTPAASAPAASPTPTPDDGWTLEQKVGQLFVVGVDVSGPADVSREAIEQYHVGNLFLHGRSAAGIDEVRALVERYTGLVGPTTTHGTPMLVSTDQEGGTVQVLRGDGFDDIPAATEQATWDVAELRERAAGWGAQLAAAGVNLDLAPVMDLVPPGTQADNPPVGALQRNYGTTVDSVSTHANAFSAGLRDSGVAVAIKHFPGLGRVTADTDSSADVVDDVTTRDDEQLDVFRAGIDAGAQLVMVSTAVYAKLDPDHPAAFSSTVVTDLLRGELGFDGLVVTDDLSGAEQVHAWSPADRAISAIDAGVDLVLVSKVPDVAPEMVQAVVHQAQVDDEFRAEVEAAWQRVLSAKSSMLG